MPLPWGHGSMSFHGSKWWLIWRDTKNKIHHENSQTDDASVAQKVLAQRALPRARAAVAELEAIANGDEIHQGDQAAGGNNPSAREPQPRANRKNGAKAKGARGTNPRKRSTRKGDSAQ